jgi:hypothetical protein
VLVRRGPQHQLFSEEVQHERDFLHSPHSSPEIPQGLRRHEEGTGVRLQHQSPRTRPGGTGGSKDRNSDMTQRDGEGNPKSKRTPEG